MKPGSNLISVIMPVFNGMPYLPEAINSILDQTEQRFQLIIIENGSTDGTVEYLNSLKHEKIILNIIKERNYIKALNKGLSLVNTPFWARIDADDITYLDRFEKQLNFLLENHEYSLVGSNGKYIDSKNKNSMKIIVPYNNDDILAALRNGENAIIHSSIMCRYYENLNYSHLYYPAEDYELFIKMSQRGKLANLSENLISVRIHSSGIIKSSFRKSLRKYKRLRVKYFDEPESFFDEFKINSLVLYREALFLFLNSSKILGAILLMFAGIIYPVRAIKFVKKRLTFL